MPDENTPDSAVYLPGRNLLLLAKSSVWCALNDFSVVALGTLNGNPFADSGPEFFDGLASLASLVLDGHLPSRRRSPGSPRSRCSSEVGISLWSSPSRASAPEKVNIAGAVTSAPSGAGPSPRRDWSIGRPTQSSEQMARVYVAPISFGLGDLVVSMPVVQALIAGSRRTGDETWLVTRPRPPRLAFPNGSRAAGCIDEEQHFRLCQVETG